MTLDRLLAHLLGVSLMLAVTVTTAEAAKTWHVQAASGPSGNGSRNTPFLTLREVEAVSQPGDTIRVLPSGQPLDGGIQLKDGQRLIGDGSPVTRDGLGQSAHAQLTNTSNARYAGDIVRLARNNRVENLHLDHAYRSSVFGINSDGAVIRNNLMTNAMAVHDLLTIEGAAPSTCGVVTGRPVCNGEWPNGYIIYAPQTNHFGAITLVSCGPNPRVEPRIDPLLRSVSYCQFLLPGSGSVSAPVDAEIAGNVIRDGNSDGIMLINDTGVTANFRVRDNVVRDLSQTLPNPTTVGSTDHVVRSRGITTITIDASVSNLTLTNFVASNLSPSGNFAADGVVFLACGVNPMMNNRLADIVVSNPLLTGDTSNGDSIEIQHRGSTNGVLNVDITRARLSDPASTNIKLIESSNPDGGVYNVTVSDSELSNVNTAGTEDAQIRYSGTERVATTAVRLTLRKVKISGLGSGIGLAVPAGAGARTLNSNSIRSFRLLVENSSLSDLTGEAIYWGQAAATAAAPSQFGTAADPPIIDLGGGPLGSAGRNRFVNNAAPGYVPRGVDASGVDAHTFDGDVSVAHTNPANPAIQVYASANYWGGGAPVVSTTPGAATDVYMPAGSRVTFTSTSFLRSDPAQ
jgi:hypothetical protein